MEIWKDIPRFKGLYQCSNVGNIRSIRFGYKKIRKQNINKYGYSNINIQVDLKQKCFKVHRLVLETFIGYCPEGMECNHKDGNRSNNTLENLEWVTCSENQKHKFRVLGYKNHIQKTPPNKGKFGKLNTNSKKILQFDKNNKFIKKWDTLVEAGKVLGILPENISMVCNGKRKHTHGFIFEFIN